MKEIAIYGAGGFGREIAVLVHSINLIMNQWKIIGFFDDGIPKNTAINGIPILGGLNDLNNVKKNLNLIIAIADPTIRKSIINKTTNSLISFPSIIHPSAIIGDEKSVILGRGSILSASCILSCNINIGNFVMINYAVTIGHDSSIEDYVSIMPNCSVSGEVKIGESTFIGTGALIRNRLKIGTNVNIGMGSVVIRNVKDNQRVFGNPAKTLLTPKLNNN